MPKKKQPITKRLMRAMLYNGAAADLLPDEARAAELFMEIAKQRGVEDAERIFAGTIRQAKAALPRQNKPKGSHAPLEDVELLSLWRMWSRQKSTINKRAFARSYMKTEWCPDRYRNVEPDTIVRRLNFLLSEAQKAG